MHLTIFSKGRVERAIRYVRDSFWAGRTFTTLAECNRQALVWRDQVAHQRRWPGDPGRSVAEVGREIFEKILAVASGEKTKSELLGYGDDEFVPWHVGPTL